MAIDENQALRIEAARMTSQVLAGSGADTARILQVFSTFVVMMQPTPTQVACQPEKRDLPDGVVDLNGHRPLGDPPSAA